MSSQYLRSSISDVARMEDRITFLFVEHCTISRDDGALTFTDENNQQHIPASVLTTLVLGPGTRITHAAVALCGESGCGIIWTGTDLSPMYAYGSPISGNNKLIVKQAEIVSSERKRLAAAKRAYSIRFPGENLEHITMQQLLGREGTRMQRAYRREAERTGVEWSGRLYRDDSPVNKALDTANHLLYGICECIIRGMGCSPALGIIHSGNPISFVFDLADVRKCETVIPAAFEATIEASDDNIRELVRKKLRSKLTGIQYMKTCVKDLQNILDTRQDETAELKLWSGKTGFIDAGRDLRAQGLDAG